MGRRLGLTVRAGSRVTPTGGRLEWQAVGMEEAAADGSLPFFIKWGSRTPFPGHTLVKHPGGTPAITRILAHGDADRLSDWLDGNVLPLTVSPGDPMLAGIVLLEPTARSCSVRIPEGNRTVANTSLSIPLSHLLDSSVCHARE